MSRSHRLQVRCDSPLKPRVTRVSVSLARSTSNSSAARRFGRRGANERGRAEREDRALVVNATSLPSGETPTSAIGAVRCGFADVPAGELGKPAERLHTREAVAHVADVHVSAGVPRAPLRRRRSRGRSRGRRRSVPVRAQLRQVVADGRVHRPDPSFRLGEVWVERPLAGIGQGRRVGRRPSPLAAHAGLAGSPPPVMRRAARDGPSAIRRHSGSVYPGVMLGSAPSRAPAVRSAGPSTRRSSRPR